MTDIRKWKAGFVLVLALLSVPAFCQPRSVGAAFGYSGIYATNCHNAGNGDFYEISLKAAMDEVFRGECDLPGLSAMFIWNIPFAVLPEREDGTQICFYAGPGATAGYVPDRGKGYGAVFGLAGNLGMEMRFSRNVLIDIFIAPTIGIHAARTGEDMRVSMYMNGIFSGIAPNVAIRYAF